MKKSNDTYGWMQDLKDLAEAEKSLEIIGNSNVRKSDKWIYTTACSTAPKKSEGDNSITDIIRCANINENAVNTQY